MKKIRVFSIILLIVIVFIGVVFVSKMLNKKEVAFKVSIEEMAKKGIPYSCTYNINYEGGDQQVQLYFDGNGKIRGEVDVYLPQMGLIKNYFIEDDNVQYMWSMNQFTGIKMKVNEEDKNRLQEQQIQQGVNFLVQVDMKCKKWVVDESKFKAPSVVEFQDLDELLEDISESQNTFDSFFNYNQSTLDDLDNLDYYPALDCDICDSLHNLEAIEGCKEDCK